MAEELEQIIHHIKSNHNFLLSGGAGCGKTFSLVQVVEYILANYPTKKVACVTYTNAAVNEIKHRICSDNLIVSTIHDFLWNCISNYQFEIRESLVHLINNNNLRVVDTIELPINNNFFIKDGDYLPIEYKDYLSVSNGVISHDEVLLLANYMFLTYPKLCDFIKGTYPFILIDEYQDTNPLVIEIFLTAFEKNPKRKCCIGLFGDSMQAIYDNVIGNIQKYTYPNGNVYEVKKEQNRRCPLSVINLANKLRLDGLVQLPSNDINAPNMINDHIKNGKILFLYSQKDSFTEDDARTYLINKEGWSFNDPSTTKELNLTNKLIASNSGFPTLLEIHSGDPIISYRKRIHSFVKQNGIDTNGKTFAEIISYLKNNYPKSDVYKPTKSMQFFIDSHYNYFHLAESIDYNSFIKMYFDNQLLLDGNNNIENDKTNKEFGSPLVRHLRKIEQCIADYQSGNYYGILRTTDMIIHSKEDKIRLHNAINKLVNYEGKTVRDIVDLANNLNLVKIDEALEEYKQRWMYGYYRTMDVPYHEVKSYYNYWKGLTPYSTQHNTKGSEFDNVFVILDNGKWFDYNFEKMFTAQDSELNNSVIQRSRKLFYVCCTRAKEQLAVFIHKPSVGVIAKAKEWFGEENVVSISD